MAAPPPLRKNRGRPLHAPSLIFPEGMGGGVGGLYTGYSWRSFFNSNLLFKLEKNKVHIQQLEGDVIRCREQVSRSEEECRAAQRELKRLQMDADDQRDALANEVSCTKNNNNNAYFPLSFYLQ